MTNNSNDQDYEGIDEKDNDSENDSDNEIGVHRNTDPLKCRMYEKEYPAIDDIVICEVKKMADMGAYCNLLEYNNLEGMLLFSELQRKRIRSVKRIVRVGRQEIVQVLRVNREKGYIDLSKKRVTPEDVPIVDERWNKAKAVHSIMRQVSVLTKKKYSMLQLYQLFGWPMGKKFGTIYDAFKWAMGNWEECLKQFPQIPDDVKDYLFKNIEKRLKPQLVTVRANVEVTCFTSEGVNAIKKALQHGIEQSTNDLRIEIKLVAPPLFTVSVNTFAPDQGISIVKQCIDTISNTIGKSGGNCRVEKEPQVIAIEI